MIKINFTPFPEITTENLTLRQLTHDDVSEIFTIRSDERVLEFLSRPACKNPDEAREFINKVNEGISRNEWIYWAIAPKHASKLVGTICLWKVSKEHSKAEIGFELLPEHQRKGIMREAVLQVIDYGFNTMQLDIIEGEVDSQNSRSIKLLKKFNFVKEKRNQNDKENSVTVMYKLSSPYKL